MGMEVKVCKQCKNIFQTQNRSDYCPACQGVMDKMFGEVKTYIRSHKSAGVEEVAEECKISKKQILNWVREERLYFDKDSQVALPCLECGTLINTGKYCDACKKKFHKNLSSAYMGKQKNQDAEPEKVKSIRKERLRFNSDH